MWCPVHRSSWCSCAYALRGLVVACFLWLACVVALAAITSCSAAQLEGPCTPGDVDLSAYEAKCLARAKRECRGVPPLQAVPVPRGVQARCPGAVRPMSRALVLLLAWLVVACSLAASSPVVAVTSPSGETVCSAFAVRSHRLLTAAHCVRPDADRVAFVRRAPVTLGVEFASVVRVSRDQDWAVLSPLVELPELVIAEPAPGPLAVEAARPGWSVTLGHLLESYYSGTATDGSDVRRWAAALDVEPGWSGSPVLQAGHVVGILQACRGEQWPRKACVRPGFATFFPASAVPL